MNADLSRWVTPDLKRELHDNGAVCVRGVLDCEWVTLLELGLERNRATPGPYTFRSYAGTDREFFNDTCNFHVIPEYRNLLYYSPVADILAELIDSSELWLYFDNFFLKEGPAAPTIWHQDVEQFICTGSQQINMWLSPDSLSAEEALAFVSGTHLGPVYDGLSPKDMAAFMSARQDRIDALRAGRRGRVGPPHPDYDRPEFANRILAWDVEPGDGLVFFNTTVHGRAPIPEGKVRRSFTARCYGDDVVYAPRTGAQPPFPGVDLFVKEGEPLRHPHYFPKLRPLDIEADPSGAAR